MKNKSENNQNTLSNPSKWVDLYGDYLFRFALSRTRNPDDAENAVQETFLAALKAQENFSGKSTERTWLTGILNHKIIDSFRKKYKEMPVTDLQSDQQAVDSFFDNYDHPTQKPTNWLPNPRELAENSEFWKIFEECLSKLPKTTADAFALREVDKVDSKEICKVLGIASTNLWVMLHRARLQLRACLETNWFNDKL